KSRSIAQGTTVYDFRNGEAVVVLASSSSRTLLPSLALIALLSIEVPAAEPARFSMENPLLSASTLPYQLPPFAAISDEHFAPAFEQGMREHLREVGSIADNPAPATFDNTIV